MIALLMLAVGALWLLSQHRWFRLTVLWCATAAVLAIAGALWVSRPNTPETPVHSAAFEPTIDASIMRCRTEPDPVACLLEARANMAE